MHPWHTIKNEIGGILLYTDIITEQVETELALLKSEEKLNLFFSHSIIDGFFIMECKSPIKWSNSIDKKKQILRVFDDLKITKVNEAFTKAYGLSDVEMLGYTYKDFFHDELERGYESIIQMLDDGKQVIINKYTDKEGSEI